MAKNINDYEHLKLIIDKQYEESIPTFKKRIVIRIATIIFFLIQITLIES